MFSCPIYIFFSSCCKMNFLLWVKKYLNWPEVFYHLRWIIGPKICWNKLHTGKKENIEFFRKSCGYIPYLNQGVSTLKTRVIQGDRCRLRERKAQVSAQFQRGHTWEMSITASQLRGRAEVRSLNPRRVEMIPFWSILRIMVPSTKKITPYLSTVMPADKVTQWEEEGNILKLFCLSVT